MVALSRLQEERRRFERAIRSLIGEPLKGRPPTLAPGRRKMALAKPHQASIDAVLPFIPKGPKGMTAHEIAKAAGCSFPKAGTVLRWLHAVEGGERVRVVGKGGPKSTAPLYALAHALEVAA